MNFKTNIEKIDTEEILKSQYINWNYFKDSSILVTGATGLIGYQTVLVLLLANEKLNTNITIYALVRNEEKAKNKFQNNITDNLHFIVQDIVEPINCPEADFIIHTANGTASKGFVEQPVETINSIVTGTKNVLEFAKNAKVKSIVYLSSMEVYGSIPLSKQEPLKENDYGYIDIMKVRNSYPLGKRMAENMCFAYFSEYNVPIKVARLSQTIGTGVDYYDNRVFAQFARNIVEKRDIILQTKGETIRCYCYITDCISAILLMIEKGKNGESYNIANPKTTCSIREMAEMLCNKYSNSKLKIETNRSMSTKYYLNTIKYCLDTGKYYNDTDWEAYISLEEMFNRLIKNFKLKIGE